MDNKEKQTKLLKESGLPLTKVAELTGINYKKIHRVIHEGGELRYTEYNKIVLLNEMIAELKQKCAEM